VSAIGLDIVLAVSQVPNGLRLTEVATVIGSPVSSVQSALRTLDADGLVRRRGDRYSLALDHHARDQMVALATVLPESGHVVAIIVRSNPAVRFAAADSSGFVVVDGVPSSDAVRALDQQLDLIRATQPALPEILRLQFAEFERLLAVDLQFRSRMDTAVSLKGHVPPTARPRRHSTDWASAAAMQIRAASPRTTAPQRETT
jgi:hypothetical protein